MFNSTHILFLGKEKSISFQHVGKEIMKAENSLLSTEKALSNNWDILQQYLQNKSKYCFHINDHLLAKP